MRERANSREGFRGLLGITVEGFEPGIVRCRLAFKPELDNTVGMIHGGAVAALVDHTVSLAVYPLVTPGAWVATTGLSLQYLAPARGADCLATGTVISLRRNSGVVRVEVENQGRLVAAGLGHVTVVENKPAAGEA